MSEPVTLDQLDSAIVAILQENGRASNRSIARDTGVSEAAIRKRLRRLIDSGLVSYGTVIDTSATNMAVLGWLLVEVHPSSLDQVLHRFAEMASCSAYAAKTGQYNVVAHLYAKDTAAMRTHIDYVSEIDGVRDVIFNQVLSYPLHRYEYVLNNSDRDKLVRWPSFHIGED